VYARLIDSILYIFIILSTGNNEQQKERESELIYHGSEREGTNRTHLYRNAKV